MSDEKNVRRQLRLRQRVASFGFSFLEGENRAVDGSWRESTLLCLGMRLQDALDLGGEFGQVAILFSDSDSDSDSDAVP